MTTPHNGSKKALGKLTTLAAMNQSAPIASTISGNANKTAKQPNRHGREDMSEWIANSDISFQTMIGDLREEYHVARYLKVKSTAGRKRSLNQNDISHVWYEQLARECREYDVLGWKCYCKLHHGVPILRAEDADYRQTYDLCIRPMSYDKKFEAMKHWPVTSLMTKKQLTAYLDSVQRDFENRNIILKFPEAA